MPKILICGEPADTAGACALLEEFGYECDVVADTGELPAILATERTIDLLVICDHEYLGGQAGFDFVNLMRSKREPYAMQRQQLPAILYSGTVDLAEECGNLPCAFVPKKGGFRALLAAATAFAPIPKPH